MRSDSQEGAREVGHGFIASEREPSAAEHLEVHRGRRAVLEQSLEVEQHLDHLAAVDACGIAACAYGSWEAH